MYLYKWYLLPSILSYPILLPPLLTPYLTTRSTPHPLLHTQPTKRITALLPHPTNTFTTRRPARTELLRTSLPWLRTVSTAFVAACLSHRAGVRAALYPLVVLGWGKAVLFSAWLVGLATIPTTLITTNLPGLALIRPALHPLWFDAKLQRATLPWLHAISAAFVAAGFTGGALVWSAFRSWFRGTELESAWLVGEGADPAGVVAAYFVRFAGVGAAFGTGRGCGGRFAGRFRSGGFACGCRLVGGGRLGSP